MDLLKQATNQIILSSDLLKVLKELESELGSGQSALEILRKHMDSAEPIVSAAIQKLQLDPKTVKNLFSKYEEELAILFQTLGDVSPRKESWPLKISQKAQIGKNTLAVSVDAVAEGFVEADDDGELLDKAILFDESKIVYVRAGLLGKLDGAVNHKGKLSTVSTEAAFKAGAELSISNFFQHSKAEKVLTALLSDVTDFKLPGMIESGHDFRSVKVGSKILPLQYIHLNASGYMEVAGSLSWQQNFLSTMGVSVESLNLDETIKVKTGVSASFSFSYLLNGDFNILLSASPDDSSKVRVQLAKSKTSQKQIGFKIGAEVGIEGLDRIAKTVLDQVIPKVDKLVKHLESNLEKYGDLKELFQSTLSTKLETLLAKQKVITQIENFLKEIDKDINLKEILKEIVTEAALKLTDAQIDKLQANLAPAVKAIKDLITKYRSALDRINDLVKKAASLKIAIEYARESKRIEQEDIALALDINPSVAPDIYRQLLLGNFKEAMQAADDPQTSVVLHSGSFIRKGLIRISTSLSINLFGFAINHSGILTQEWQSEVDLNGDISIGVKSSFLAKHSSWKKTRTATFLADTRVVASVGQGNISADTFISMELTVEDDPKIKDLEAFDAILQRLQVTDGPTTMVKDIALKPGDDKPFGKLQMAILVEFSADQLDNMLLMPESTIQLVFANELLNYYITLDDFALFDKEGVPVLLWPSVQNEFKKGKFQINTASPKEFSDKFGQKNIILSVEKQALMFNYCKYIKSFSEMMKRLHSLRGTFKGVSEKDLTKEILNVHRSILNEAKPLLQGPLLGMTGMNYAFFKSLWLLANTASDINPYAVVRRISDDRVFVYG